MVSAGGGWLEEDKGLTAQEDSRRTPVPVRYQGQVVRQPFPAVLELEQQLLFRVVQRDGGVGQLAQMDQDGQALEKREQGIRGKSAAAMARSSSG